MLSLQRYAMLVHQENTSQRHTMVGVVDTDDVHPLALICNHFGTCWTPTPTLGELSCMINVNAVFCNHMQRPPSQCRPYLCLSVQVYHSVHMVGFLGYVLFALVHYPGMWASCVPGNLSLTPAWPQHDPDMTPAYVSLQRWTNQEITLNTPRILLAQDVIAWPASYVI